MLRFVSCAFGFPDVNLSRGRHLRFCFQRPSDCAHISCCSQTRARTLPRDLLVRLGVRALQRTLSGERA